MTRLTRHEAQEATRQRMLDAAAELFSARGYAASTMEEIAERAGHTRSAVYKAIGGKETLFLAVAARRGEQEWMDWADRLAVARSDEQRLTALAEFILARISSDDRWELAVAEFLAGAAADPGLMQQVLAIQHVADAHVATIVDHMCAALGVQPELPSDQLALILVGLANGLATRAVLDPTFDLRRTLSSALNVLLRAEPDIATAPSRTGSGRR